MLKPRWQKLRRDITLYRGRTAMMILGIAVSLFGVGTALTAYGILEREMRRNYAGTRPASATLRLAAVSRGLVDAVRRRPGIADAEARARLLARVEIAPGDWRPLLLFVVDDFDHLRLNTFRRESGAWPPPAATMLVERAALPVLHAELGDSLRVRLPDGRERTLAVSGIVHDPGLSAAWQEGAGYGYVTVATRTGLDGPTPPFDELRILVAEHPDDAAHIATVARDLAAWLAQTGHPVTRIEVPPPGRHPHESQMKALLSILLGFSLLALVLSGILVAAMIAALLAREIRQIGVMKAIGATTGQLARLYAALVLALGAAACALSLPPGLWAGRAFAAKAAAMLNFILYSNAAPWWVFAVQVAAGIGVPLAIAAFPIARACRITVRAALGDHGLHRERFAAGWLDAGRGLLAKCDRILLLALRNAFRRRARTLLTLGLLATAGALFMASWNVQRSWQRTLVEGFAARDYDLEVRLTRALPAAGLLATVRAVPGVVDAEAWGVASTTFGRPGQFDVAKTYPDGGHGSLGILAPPAATRMVHFPVTAGRWLRPGDGAAVVLNPSALGAAPPGTRVGDWLDLSLAGAARVQVVGLVREVGAGGTVYMTDRALARAVGRPDAARMLRLRLADHGAASRRSVTAAVESALTRSGAALYAVTPAPAFRAAIGDHILILIQSLAFIGVLMAVVGGLGLAATMSVTVLERTRELGVLQALGAAPSIVLRLVVGEGLVIGLLSWVVALAAALPLTWLIDTVMGRIFFAIPLTPAFAPGAMLVWLVLVILTAAAASLLPAWRASRLAVAAALQYG